MRTNVAGNGTVWKQNTELINLFQLSVTFDIETSNLIDLKGKLMMKPVHKKAAKCLLF